MNYKFKAKMVNNHSWVQWEIDEWILDNGQAIEVIPDTVELIDNPLEADLVEEKQKANKIKAEYRTTITDLEAERDEWEKLADSWKDSSVFNQKRADALEADLERLKIVKHSLSQSSEALASKITKLEDPAFISVPRELNQKDLEAIYNLNGTLNWPDMIKHFTKEGN